MGRSFAEVSNHTQVIEEMYSDAYGGSDKRPRNHGSFSRNYSSSLFTGSYFNGRYPPRPAYQSQSLPSQPN